MNFTRGLVAAFGAALTLGLAACGGSGGGGGGGLAGTSIQTLSNRADLVSGGDVLMEIKLPAGASASKLKVTVNSLDQTAAFSTLPSGRVVGRITNLYDGANSVIASAKDSSFQSAQLIVENHPKNGPVILSTQIQPWVCATPVPTAASGNTPATNGSGLSTAATDAQCNIATETKLWYRTKTPVTVTAGDGGCSFVLPDPTNAATPANSCFQPYVAGTTSATVVASTTTTNNVTVPYIVRVERGVINRGIYDIAVLFDPTKPWTPTAPQSQWNGKVVYSFGASTGQPRLQFRSEQNWADNDALSRGFLVVDNSLTDSLYNSNRILVAETAMMMKEYIVDNYGEIAYMAGNGCSGGSIQQNTILSTFPGLLDGIQVACDFPDSITTGIEVTDCVLLVNAYVTPEWTALMGSLTQAQINAKKAAINGHRDQLGCHGWNNSFGNNNKPGNYVPVVVTNANGSLAPFGAARNNCGLPAALVYDPVTNPTGTRCGDPDLAPMVWGTTAGIPANSTRALQTFDNVGVQYGLKALLSGAITPEEFVTLNEKIGGVDADSNRQAARSAADTDALTIAYQAGIVSSGKNLAKASIIDQRGYDEGPTSFIIHFNWRSFEERARLDNEAGSHANQVIWRFGPGLLPPASVGLATTSLVTTDAWLSALMTAAPKAWINDQHTQAQVVAAKPATAFDFCYLSADTTYSTKVTDQAACDADPILKYYTSPHQVAGGPQAENILKCQLKPLVASDYTGITFTAGQLTRLNAVFPDGVCDWTKPGVGQQDPVSPMTFSAGPGGVPLGPPPTSMAI